MRGKYCEPDGSRIRVAQLDGIMTPDTAQASRDVDDGPHVSNARWSLRRRNDQVIRRRSGKRDYADGVVLGNGTHAMLLDPAIPLSYPRRLRVGTPSRGEDRFDERGLAVDIRFTIARISRRQLAFQLAVIRSRVRMREKIVSKGSVIIPELTADRGKMYVVLPRLATPEEVTARDALLATKDVASGLQRGDGNGTVVFDTATGKDVQHRFGGKPLYGRTPHVLEHQRNAIGQQDRLEASDFRCIQFGPRRVIRHHPNDTRLQPKRSGHSNTHGEA
jgi:hypothetical protein